MAVDSRQPSHLNGISYGYGPHFSNPWGAAQTVSSAAYATSQATAPALDAQSQLHQRNLTLPPYNAVAVTTAMGSGPSLLAAAYGHATNVPQQQYPQYTTAGSTGYQSVTAPGYINLPDNRAAAFSFAQNDTRRPSHQYVSHDASINFNAHGNSFGGAPSTRETYGDVVDASRQILSLGQNDITPTPRNMYGDQSTRSSPDSYGFPTATHSNHSSISSASGVHSNYSSSIGDYPLTDYSSASESVDLNHRTLPRPGGSMGSASDMPPAPQSMMGQFSSKVSSSTQKKHKCKVCDKRFTRPSSLQTHIYSHTGEKRKCYFD
jgi:hypothetical protein